MTDSTFFMKWIPLIKQKILKDSIYVYIAHIVAKLKGLIIAPFIISALGKEGYGIWIQTLTTVTFFASISEMNLHSALIRFGSGVKDNKYLANVYYQITILGFSMSTIAALLLFIFAKPLSLGILKSPPTERMLQIGSVLVIILTVHNISQNFFRAQYKIKTFAGIQTITVILQAIGIFLWLQFIKSPYSILNGYLTASLVVIIALFIYIFTHYDIRPALRYKSEWIKYLMFSLPALPTLLSSWFFTYVDRYFISYYSGTGEVGIYSLAYTLGSLPMFFVSPLGTVLFPVLSKLWDEKKYVEGKRKVQSSMFAFLIFGIPFLVIIFFFSKSLLTFISANSEFGVQGRWITPIVALSHIFFGLIYLLNYFYYSIKKTYYITIIFVIGAAINFITNLWFVPKYGSLGAAVTTLLSFVLMFIITLVFIVKLGFKHEK